MKLTDKERAVLAKQGITAFHRCDTCRSICNMLLTYYGQDKENQQYCKYACLKKGEQLMIDKKKNKTAAPATAPDPDPAPVPVAAAADPTPKKKKKKKTVAAPVAAADPAPAKAGGITWASGSIGEKIWLALKSGPQTLDQITACGAADPRRRCSTMNERLIKLGNRYRIVYEKGTFSLKKEPKPSV